LLDQEVFRKYLAGPERLGDVLSGSRRTKTVILDEIQKVPSLLDEVHRLMELAIGRQVQFILTGSSARKLKRSGTDLLAGRAILKTMHPFMAAELGPRFQFAQSLEFGMLPLVLNSAEPTERLKTCASLYLREEVQTATKTLIFIRRGQTPTTIAAICDHLQPVRKERPGERSQMT
jgi:predicted AAA+ superfamily ATPase